jgi:hypothetical protein
VRRVAIAFILAASVAVAQQPVATLPFSLFHNRVYLPVLVNSLKTFEFVVDTGAAVSGISEATAQALALKTNGKALLSGNGEIRLRIAVAKDVTLNVGAAELIEKSFAIVPFDDLERHEGRSVEGVLGVNLYRRYVVVIDYPAKTLALYEPASFAYQGSGEIIPLRFNNGAACFRASIAREGHDPIPSELAVDSGTYSALRLYRPYAQKNGIRPATAVDSFGFGIGGEFPEKLGRVGMLKIGALAIAEPPTSFSEAKSGVTASDAYDGTIGGEILSRFKVIFEYSHKQIVLESNAASAAPFPVDTSGLILEASGTNFKTVGIRDVLPNTPAAAAGIQEGDILLSANYRDAQDLGLEGIRRLFLNAGDFRLRLGRAGQILELNLTTVRPLY